MSTATSEFSAVMAVFNLLLRGLSIYLLYTEWGLRETGQAGGKAVTVRALSEGGSVRSGSVLQHYPGAGGLHTVHLHT